MVILNLNLIKEKIEKFLDVKVTACTAESLSTNGSKIDLYCKIKYQFYIYIDRSVATKTSEQVPSDLSNQSKFFLIIEYAFSPDCHKLQITALTVTQMKCVMHHSHDIFMSS
jgi:hypothetical protein